MRLSPRSICPKSVHPDDQRADEAEDQARVAVRRAGAVCLGDGLGQQFAARAGHCGLHDSDDDLAEAGVADRDGETDQGDDRLHEGERRRVRERAGMTEAVGDAQTQERILQEPDVGRYPARRGGRRRR